MKGIIKIILVLLTLLIIITPAFAWWDSDWDYRKQINLTNDGSTLNDYILQIELDWDSDMANDFSDVRFTDSDDNELDYWIQKYNSGVNATIRVEIPEIKADDSSYIWVYYGTGSVSSTSDFDALYPDIKRLYTFDFDSTSTAIDYSGNVNGTFYNIESGDFVNGRIGKAVKLDGVNEYADFGNLGFNKNATFCLLLDDYDDTSAPSSTSILSNSHVSSWSTIGYRANFVHNADEEQIEFAVSNNGGTGTSVKSSATELEGMKSQWTQMCFTWYVGDNMTIYVNGSQVASTSATFTNTALDPEHLFLARKINSGDTTPFTADEVMIWDDALNETEVAKFWAEAEPTYTFGEEETSASNSAPTITLNYPSDGATKLNKSVILNWTVSDTDNDLVNVTLYNSSGYALQTNNSISPTDILYTWSNLNANTTYTYNITAIDNNSNIDSDIFTFTTMDYPYIPTLGSPKDVITNQTTLSFNWTNSSYAFQYYLRIYNSIGTLINENITTSNFTSINGLTEGNFSFEVIGNNSFGLGTSSGNETFYVDLTAPIVSILAPINITYSSAITEVNYSITETNPNYCWINNGTDNTAIDCTKTNWSYSSHEGSNHWTIYANDSAGNIHSNEIYFSVDTIEPAVSISYPTEGANYTHAISYMNVSVSNAESCWYSVDSGVTNTSFTCSDTQITSLSGNQGDNVWTIYANDSAGNENITSINFWIDSVVPLISWTQPVSGTIYDQNNLSLDITVTDNNLYGTNVSIINSTGQAVFFDERTDLTGTSFDWTNNTGVLTSGFYNITVCASDDHTSQLLNKSNYSRISKEKYEYEIIKGEKVSIELLTKEDLNSSSTSKLTDRYSLEYVFNKSSNSLKNYTFQVLSNSSIIYRKNSEYKAHFVVG